MIKLTKEKEASMRDEFLKRIGRVISTNRKKKGMTQKELSSLVGVDRTVISDYENATPHKTISTLPIISHYCDFDVSEYFYQPNLESCMTVLDELIHILTIEPVPRSLKAPQDIHIGNVYRSIDHPEKIYTVNIPQKATSMKYIWKRDIFKGYLDTRNESPFSPEELKEYLSRSENRHICELLEAGKTMLYTSKKAPTLTEKRCIAEYIISRLLEEANSGLQKRLIAYFRMHFESYEQNKDRIYGRVTKKRYNS